MESSPFRVMYKTRQFAQKTDLISHKWLHSGEQPFSCDVCCKAFGQMAVLLRHQQVHSEEQPLSSNMMIQSVSG